MIRSLDLVGELEEDLLAELACEGVVGVKRITRKADGVDVPTPSIILTLNLGWTLITKIAKLRLELKVK